MGFLNVVSPISNRSVSRVASPISNVNVGGLQKLSFLLNPKAAKKLGGLSGLAMLLKLIGGRR